MEALAPTTLSEIAKAPDPIAALAELARAVTVDDDGSVLIFGAPLMAYDAQQIVGFRAAFRALQKRVGDVAGTCDAAIAQKMAADGATELFHPDYEVTYKPVRGETMVHEELLYNGLTRLADEGKCDPAQVRKAVSRTETVVYKASMTSIKPLMKLGGEVAHVIESAVRVGEDGPPRLVIREKR